MTSGRCLLRMRSLTWMIASLKRTPLVSKSNTLLYCLRFLHSVSLLFTTSVISCFSDPMDSSASLCYMWLRRAHIVSCWELLTEQRRPDLTVCCVRFFSSTIPNTSVSSYSSPINKLCSLVSLSCFIVSQMLPGSEQSSASSLTHK